MGRIGLARYAEKPSGKKVAVSVCSRAPTEGWSPNVLDRLIQQATLQVLTPIFDPGFSESSFGFRPGRSAHGAAKQVQRIIRQGYAHVIDVDLLKFFDRVQQVFESVQRYVTQTLKLVVNQTKSQVTVAEGCEYLGFAFVSGRRATIKVAPKKLKAFKRRVKELTGRSRGISIKRRLTDLTRYLRGWIGYFGLARQLAKFSNLDGWIRRRIRMCHWKQWRYPRTKVRRLTKLGVDLDMAIKHAVSRKGYWRMCRMPAMRYAMTNKWLQEQGLFSLKQRWSELAPLRRIA